MGKLDDIWISLGSELERNGYIFEAPQSLTLQIVYPDGFRSRMVSRGRENDVLQILEDAHSHLRQTEMLLEAGYSKDVEGFGWAKDSELFKDFRFAWLHLEGKKKYEHG